jgi:hypothetical protein
VFFKDTISKKGRESMNEQPDASQQQEVTEVHAQPSTAPPISPLPPPQQLPSEHFKSSDDISKSDRIMIAATIVIAFGTLVSAGAIWLQYREMVGGSVQTNALIRAAGKQADAAKQFSDTAEKINSHMSDTVEKLNIQAAQTELLAKHAKESLEQTRINFQSEQRPFIGAAAIKPQPPNVGKRILVNLWWVNYGKSPAIRAGWRGIAVVPVVRTVFVVS